MASDSSEGSEPSNIKKDPKSPGAVATNRSGPFEMFPISDITEESHNSSQQSELNVSLAIENSVSAHPNGSNSTSTASDVNPLLVTDDGYSVERRKRPVVIKRSPNFARAANRGNMPPLETRSPFKTIRARPSTLYHKALPTFVPYLCSFSVLRRKETCPSTRRHIHYPWATAEPIPTGHLMLILPVR